MSPGSSTGKLILSLWAAYNIPPEIEDSGDKYKINPLWRGEKKRMRGVFVQAVVQTCPDAMHMMDEQTEQSVCGLCMLLLVATAGVALYKSFKDVAMKLVKIRECVKRDDGPLVEKLDCLVAFFSPNGLPN